MNKKPEVPKEVLEGMWQFFLKTSVPRIIDKHLKKKEAEKDEIQ